MYLVIIHIISAVNSDYLKMISIVHNLHDAYNISNYGEGDVNY